jgi:type II secretory pathway pseudopilin PulG
MNKKAFTLFEMVIVLVILWIITLMIMGLTGTQIQKLQQKTEKESLLTTYHNRYSKNLTSSFFAGQRYSEMKITFTSGTNEIKTEYFSGDQIFFTGSYQGDFQIKRIITDKIFPSTSADTISLLLLPYGIPCVLGEDETLSEIILIIRMKKQKDYYFSISSQNCRMTEIKCDVSRNEICESEF